MDRDTGPVTRPEPAGGDAGAAFADLVAVMDRLRSPGGCPWDAQQTHRTLLPHAIEEVAEVVEAVEADDRDGMREELGDLLLQVLFHARIAQEHPDDPFDIGDVAAGIAAKLRRRHPHVFGPEPEPELGAAEVHRRWEDIKRVEKGRGSALDGVPPQLAALARADKVLSRASRAGLEVSVAGVDDVGARLLDLVVEARAAGIDAEAALRARVREVESALRDQERSRPPQ